MSPFDILIFASFLTEIGFLSVMEYKIWGTLYTPLNILMLPSAFVVVVCVVAVPLFQLYPFYFPSLLIWEAGLAVFFLPSLFFSSFVDGSCILTQLPKYELPAPKLFFWGTMGVILVYFYHLKSVLASSTAGLGSEDFASESSGGGLWSHLFVLCFMLEIICFSYISRKRWYFIIPILLVVAACVLNQVKGWILIPLLAGLMSQIFAGRLRITPRLVLLTLIGGASFFFLSYYLSLVVSEDKELTNDFMFFIFKNFFHYLSSGFLGLSMDCDMGIIEQQSVEYLFTPFINIYNLFSGDPLLSNLNTHYLGTSWPGLQNNIRSFMGTIYVFGGPWFFVLVVLLVSTVAYWFRILLLRKKSLTWLLIDAWFCSFLFMGWFDYYFALLKPFEVIGMLIIFSLAMRFFKVNTIDVEPQST